MNIHGKTCELGRSLHDVRIDKVKFDRDAKCGINIPPRWPRIRIVTQVRLLIPLTSLTRLLAIAAYLTATTLLTSADCRCPSGRCTAIPALAACIVPRVGILEALKSMEHFEWVRKKLEIQQSLQPRGTPSPQRRPRPRLIERD